MPHLHAIVKGRVQGVGYRFFALDAARRLRLTGFVRNLPDGDVEVHAEGPEQDLSTLVAALKKGPAFSHVFEVVTEVTKEEQGFEEFQIKFW